MLEAMWHGERLLFDGRGALGWPAREMVIITDPHFGKDAHFRKQGIPAPAGPLQNDLARLTAIVRDHAVKHLRILGDFFHAADGARARDTLEGLSNWRAAHRQLRIDLVLGNHDEHAGRPPLSLGIECFEDYLDDAPLIFRHHPPRQPNLDHAAPPCMAGHVHPAVVLNDGATTLRCRCFLLQPHLALLPAFGSFTGSATVRPQIGDRVFAINGEAVVEI